jgi:protein gp37
MGEASAIEWTDSTWNPWRGCTKVDPTCADCYMFTEQRRYGRDPSVVVRCTPQTFNAPLSRKWATKRAECIADHGRHLVFTCSWSDWFHEDADPWRDEAWDVIRRCPDSVFQVLTSRPERILEHLPADWGDGWPNVWMGVTIGTRKFVHRADLLRAVPAAVRFLSCEPLLGPLRYDSRGQTGPEMATRCVPCWATGDPLAPQLDLTDIDWVIVGGESGGRPGRRLVDEDGTPIPHKLEWVRAIRDACKATAYEPGQLTCCGASRPCGHCDSGPVSDGPRTAFLFKQWGGKRSTSHGRVLDGRAHDEMPPLAGVLTP